VYNRIATLSLALSILVSVAGISAGPLSPACAQSSGGKSGQAAGQQNLSFAPLAGEEGIVGLNYTIGEHGYPTISDIYKSGPADKSGLKVGDEIVAIDGEDTRFVGYLHFQPLLTGASGSKVSLTVRSANGDGGDKKHEIERVNVETFKDSSLHKYDVARWAEAKAPAKPANHLIDLPFAMLAIGRSFSLSGERARSPSSTLPIAAWPTAGQASCTPCCSGFSKVSVRSLEKKGYAKNPVTISTPAKDKCPGFTFFRLEDTKQTNHLCTIKCNRCRVGDYRQGRIFIQ